MSGQSPAGSEQRWRAAESAYPDTGIHAALGLRLRIVGLGETVVEYGGVPGGANRSGKIAGGAVAEMVDSAVVQAAATHLVPGDLATTLELKINYLRPADATRRIIATASLLHVGRTTAVGVATVRDEAGQVVAFGSVTVAIRRATPASEGESS